VPRILTAALLGGNSELSGIRRSGPFVALWIEKDEALKLEKAQMENGIANSTGAVREQWKYRLAVWKQKMKAVKIDDVAAEAVTK
jgi:hypothetical protein